MAKRVQLVLTKDVNKLGKLGDLVEVAPGYARNYLIPQSLAARATPGLLKQVERRREKEYQRQLELKQQATEQKTALENIAGLKIAKQVGENEAIGRARNVFTRVHYIYPCEDMNCSLMPADHANSCPL